ncbi:MAG: 30S ribosomal protein S3, partial [bacterium]
MGQKVHPVGFRLGVIRDWDSRWYAERDYQRFLHEDLRIRRYLKSKLKEAGVSRVTIERAANKAKVFVHAAKPGLIIGKRAAGLDTLRADLQKMSETEIFLNIIEVRKVET